MRRARMARLATAAMALAATVLGACGSTPGAQDGRLSVVAGFYPLQFVAERVGGDRVAVVGLAPPGAEPHDLELKPSQIASIADADVVVYLPGFQPEVDAVVDLEAADKALDAGAVVDLVAPADQNDTDQHGTDQHDGHDHAGADPHFWLDPTRLAVLAEGLAGRLAELDPEGAAGYRERAADLRSSLEALDREYAERLSTCVRREIVVSHAAFGYLARRYRLEQIGISGLAPEGEPTPAQIAAVAAAARDHAATTIFFETLVSPDVAEAIAREVGAQTAVLDPIEGPPAAGEGDYLSVMRANLTALTTALGCS